MKRRFKPLLVIFLVITILTVVLVISAWLIARNSVASEGYDTNEAAWNYLVRSGEIRFKLQEGSVIRSLTSGSGTGIVSSANEAYVKLEYGIFKTKLIFQNQHGQIKDLNLITSKLNNWNRVLYLENTDGSFDRYDNGVLQDSD